LYELGGFLGLAVGVHASAYEQTEHTLFVKVLNQRHPKELGEVFTDDGFSRQETEAVFQSIDKGVEYNNSILYDDGPCDLGF